MKEIDPLKSVIRGNRSFFVIGFLIVGIGEGFFHWQESSDRSGVKDGVAELTSQIQDMRIDVAELKTTVEIDEKQNVDFKGLLALLDAEVKKVEIDQAAAAAREATRRPGG